MVLLAAPQLFQLLEPEIVQKMSNGSRNDDVKHILLQWGRRWGGAIRSTQNDPTYSDSLWDVWVDALPQRLIGR